MCQNVVLFNEFNKIHRLLSNARTLRNLSFNFNQLFFNGFYLYIYIYIFFFFFFFRIEPDNEFYEDEKDNDMADETKSER